MVDRQAINKDRGQRRRRSLGCAAWALFMAAFGMIAAFLVINVLVRHERGAGTVFYHDWLVTSLGLILIAAIIFVPTAAALGWFTRPPSGRRLTFMITLPGFTIAFVLSIAWLIGMCNIGESGPRCISLWQTSYALPAAVACGMVLGLIGSYGYWRSGR